jgi:preprotein translocase subunit SecG
MSLSRGHHKLAHAVCVVVVLTVSGLLASQTSRGTGWMNHFGGGEALFVLFHLKQSSNRVGLDFGT